MKGKSTMLRLSWMAGRLMGRPRRTPLQRAMDRTLAIPQRIGTGGGFGIGAASGALIMYAIDRGQMMRRRSMAGPDGAPAETSGTTGSRVGQIQAKWSVAPRILAGVAGGTMITYGIMRRNVLGWGLGAVGAGLMARSISNKPVTRMTRMGSSGRGISINKKITINAPVEEVYRYWTNYENFPQFMRNVRQVTDLGNGRSHWVVAGPADTTVEWDAIVTRQQENKLMSWKSVPGAEIQNSGKIHFQRLSDNSTRVHVHLRYAPPAGAVGHGIAVLMGADPKSEMDEDLHRLKSTIETQHGSHIPAM